MLQPDSPLRRLPRDTDPKHAFYLDGMRHAAEIASLAWERLLATLTKMADSTRREEPSDTQPASAFLDAWSVVDAVDRFRTLWKKAPFGPTEEGDCTFWELTEELRKVRNVGDHLIGHEQQIISADTGAMGTLHWITLDRFDPPSGALCWLRPGFLPKIGVDFGDLSQLYVDPGQRTTAVRLKAGNNTADLTDTMTHLRARVEHLESALTKLFADSPFEERAASDVLACATFTVPKHSL